MAGGGIKLVERTLDRSVHNLTQLLGAKLLGIAAIEAQSIHWMGCHPGRAKRMAAMSGVTVISFDGDMTLWDFQKVMRHSLRITLAELRRRVPGKATSDLTVDKMIAIRNAAAAELKGKTVNLEEIRLGAFERTLEFVGCTDDALAADLNTLYLKHRFQDIELYPDVIPTLDTLRSKFSLGLISNGNGYPERCGLAGRFSFVVFSQDVGFDKPDPRIFLAACAEAGCDPTELMHIGDSLEADVAGANAVGATSVWLNRTGKQNATGITPGYEIRSLAQQIKI